MAAKRSIESNKSRKSELPNMNEFATRLLDWFDLHGRKDLPWQRDINPYRVWVSEIMLQQTQVQTVIPYYERFMQRFPAIADLASADIDEVLKHWSGLGYYARARNMHRAARLIRDEHGGTFPRSINAVESLPGIGRSTAGAILSLAFGQRHAILDGNVKRVLSRHAAIDGWPGKSDVAAKLWQLSDKHMPTERVSHYTQAIMDLGATVCTRARPHCDACPVRYDCVAHTSGNVSNYPGRKARKAKPLRQTTMVMAVSNNAVYLERRPPSGIWGGLWGFPELEPDNVKDWCAKLAIGNTIVPEKLPSLRHSFSHYDLDIHPVVVHLKQVSNSVADSDDVTWYQLDQQAPGGVAAPVQKLLESLRNSDDVANH
jgi:A/G-specific adenine glycosylase